MRAKVRVLAITAVAGLALVSCSGVSASMPPAARTAQATPAQAPAPAAAQPAGSPAAPALSSAAAAPTMAGPSPAPLAATAAPPTGIPTPVALPTGGVPGTTALQVPADCRPGVLTPAQTEGPYYKANPPRSSSLAGPNITGTRLTIAGYVFDANCKPIAGARVDFWQADSQGQYDNSGYRLRGYQLTDAQGRYTLETVVPGLYPGRTRHIHVKVTPPGGPTLTTQLYFPDEPANSTDPIFSARTVLRLESRTAAGEVATYSFEVKAQ